MTIEVPFLHLKDIGNQAKVLCRWLTLHLTYPRIALKLMTGGCGK